MARRELAAVPDRARLELEFEQPYLLGPLFGDYDRHLITIEQRLGVHIAARGNRVQIEGDPDAAARARDVLIGLYNRLDSGHDVDSEAVEAVLGMAAQPTLDGIVQEGDLATIRQPLDLYGLNYYNPFKLGAAGEDAEMPFEFRELLGYPVTDFGWPVVPDALREWLILLRARYRAALPPIYITESGCAYNMGPDEHGVVDDQPRIDYLDAHLRAVATAVQRGVDVRGYYTWSLLDNFEWSEGYSQRFGLVHVDYDTQVRTPKRSFQWYADTIAAQTRSIG